MGLSDKAQLIFCDETASPQGATVSPGSGQLLDGQIAPLCPSWKIHVPRPFFHCFIWVPATGGPVLQLRCSVSLRRHEVGQLKH